MQKTPHTLIEGIAITAFAVGANRAYIYIRGEYELQADILEAALVEAKDAGPDRRAHLRWTSPRKLWVHLRGAGAYICGEETALLTCWRASGATRALQAALPGDQRPYQGPTLINNVETLMNALHVPDGRRRVREDRHGVLDGTKVVSVSGCVRRPGNYEVVLGTPDARDHRGPAGGAPEGFYDQGVLPGGSSAPVLPGTDENLDLPYDFDSMAKAGSMLGSGAIIVIDDSIRMVDVASRRCSTATSPAAVHAVPRGHELTVKMLERIESGEATPMDLDIMASVCEQIMGNCLCVLGDAMAMPIGSMIKHFRLEFEAHIEAARERNARWRCRRSTAATTPAPRSLRPDRARAGRNGGLAPRPEDGDPHDRRSRGERPGERPCSSTAPSTATSRSPSSATSPSSARPSAPAACAWSRSRAVLEAGDRLLHAGQGRHGRPHPDPARLRRAQARGIVEFPLINHPLDCPVCDKGGECPLQDISFGWGGGRSRFVEPKRHFEKPLALSPLIAIDRERCILCYRCVRFSQEVSEDYQLVLAARTADTYVATFDGHPYVAPFSGNIIELCPVGALTSRPYRFRARPWDIEGSGSVCTLCPSQCNVELTVRDERVLRVISRVHEEVDDGWLCDKGRFAYQAIHVDERITQPLVREGGTLRGVSWERALDEAARGLSRAGSASAALAGGETTNEEGFLLQRLTREAVGSAHMDSRAGGSLPVELHAALGAPVLQATVPDLQYAHAILVLDTEPVDDMPIVDLRIRKGVRRNRVKLAVATSRPSSLDRNAAVSVRYAPGCGEAFVAALNAALGGEEKNFAELVAAAGTTAEGVRAVADLLAGAGGTGGPGDVVILWGERLTHGRRGAAAARGLLNVAGHLALAGREGAGLLEVPAGTNGRGLREVGVLPRIGPGMAQVASPGALGAAGIRDGLAAGELSAVHLLHVDPLADLSGRAAWKRGLEAATTVVAHSAFLTEGLREHATVIFPAESYAEKEGTVTHPDGRVQRLRPAIGHPGEVRPGWQVLAELMKRAGHDPGVLTGAMVSRRLFEAVGMYAGLTLEELGGRGVRWPARAQAAAWPQADLGPFGLESPPAAPSPNGELRLGTFRSIWAGPAVGASPALRFLVPKVRVEMAPADAQRRNVTHGDHVTLGADGSAVEATVMLRDAVPEGTVFMETNALDPGLVDVRKAPPESRR